MKSTTLWFLALLLLSACSDDIQISLERDETEEATPPPPMLPTETNSPHLELATIAQADNTITERLVSHNTNASDVIAQPDQAELEASLAAIDDSKILSTYNRDNDPIPLHLGSVPLYLNVE